MTVAYEYMQFLLTQLAITIKNPKKRRKKNQDEFQQKGEMCTSSKSNKVSTACYVCLVFTIINQNKISFFLLKRRKRKKETFDLIY